MVNDSPLYVIVGGTSSLGKTIIPELLLANRKVVSASRVAGVRFNNNVLNLPCDVTNFDDCQRLAEVAFGMNRRIFVVFLAGISIDTMLHKASPENWRRVIETNLEGAFKIARAFLPEMRTTGYGRFAWAGSITSRLGTPGTGSYSASKEGLKAMSKVIACENASKGITSNVMEIGYMNTGLIHTVPEETQIEKLKQIPAGKFGDPSELTSILLMLENSLYVNGSVISITGGL